MLRAVVLVAVAAAAVGVMGNAIGPIPSMVYRKETFAAASGCTGSVLKVEAAPVNYCSYADLNSTMAVIGPGGNLTQVSWVAGFSATTGRNGMCSGPFTSLPGDGELTTGSGVCVGGNVKYTYPITDAGAQWATETIYTDGNCNTPKSGPVSFQLNTCIPDGNGNAYRYVVEADPTKWIKTTYTGSTTCATNGADDNERYGNVCLAPPPYGSFSLQYTAAAPATVMMSSTAVPFSSTAGTVNPSSSTGTNGAGSVLHAASALSAGVAAVAAAFAIAAL